MAINQNAQSQIEGLATLLVLDEEIRKLNNIREFGFFSTNETHRLIPYHTAYLWQIKDIIGTHLIAQSGTAEIDIHAPDNQWLVRKINNIRNTSFAKELHQVDRETKNQTSENQWPENIPEHLLWCPLLSKSNQLSGGLIFFRETPFTDSEIKMLQWLIASYQYTWLVISKPQKIPSISKLKERPYFIGAMALLLSILFFPIRISVYADGTVSPKTPVLINSPIQGVIKSFSVSPGEHVKQNQLLFTLDKTDLNASVQVNQKDYLLTQAKLRTAIHESFEHKDSRSEIPIIRAQLDIDKANLDYANELLEKAEVRSPIDGIVIFDSKEDWVGQPVKTGERILEVANPDSVELKITLPVANSIELSIGSKGDFYLYGQLNSLSFHLTTLGYNAKLMPNKILAYQLVGEFDKLNTLPQIGAQGTVKIYGHYVPFIYYILRRPLQITRRTLGV